MKQTRSNNMFMVELEDGETFTKVEHRERKTDEGRAVHFWIQISIDEQRKAIRDSR